MKKLNLDALKERAEATASTELLASINGGLENACHDAPAPAPTPPASSTSYEINAGVSAPVGSPATWTLGIKIKF